jgi:hypothetical protein
MDFREQCRGVHDGDQRCAGGCCFACIKRAVGDDACDGAANFGVAEVGFGSLIFSACGFKLAFGGFERGFVADGFHTLEMFLSGVEGGLGLDERGL